MEIIKLAPGEVAPVDADCIKISEASDGGFTLVASALKACGDSDNPDSVALVSSDPYPSYGAAEAAGLAWAQECCVAAIFIGIGGEPEPIRRSGG